METTRSNNLLNRFHHLLRLPLRLLAASLLPSSSPPRLLSLVSLNEHFLCLTFLRHGLVPSTVDLSSSTSIHLWIPSTRTLHKPPLLLIHGFGANSKWQFQHQIGHLSRSFDLYVPDLVFFGRSATDGEDRSVEFQARCVVDAMRRLGVARYSVCGISYGGFVAYRVADLAEEEEVERVVIISSGIGATEEQRREIVAKEDRDLCEILLPQRPEDLMALMRRSLYRPPRWMPEFLLHDFIEVMYRDRRKERVELLREVLHNGVGAKPLPVINKDTLIIWGDRDDVFPLFLAYQLQRHLGDRARIEIVKDTGHACQMENPQLVNHLIEWFLLDQKS